jgi:hypothetical protein
MQKVQPKNNRRSKIAFLRKRKKIEAGKMKIKHIMKLSSKYEKIFFCTTVKNGRNKCVTNIRKIISQEFQGIFLKSCRRDEIAKIKQQKISEVL